MLRDLRFGIRMLLKQPGFTALAVLTLALGIGATAAVFCLVQGVLLTPPPYRQPEQLALVATARTDGQPVASPRGWPAAQWQEWAVAAESVEALAAYTWAFNFLILSDGSESLEGMRVTGDYFTVLGLEPLLGRRFLESETQSPPKPVVILGHELWQRRFGGDRGIVGETVRISRWETAPTVVGVMPPGVRFLPSPTMAQEPNYDVDALVDFWIPGAPDPERLNEPWWNVVGRLREGVTHDGAQAELSVIARRQASADPEFAGIIPEVRPLIDEFNRDGERLLLPLLGAAALVLLIACGNAAGLLLVRGLQRQQEYAVRSALGVGRAALFRQASAESLLLALLGGAAGAGLGLGIVRAFKLIGGHAIPRLDAVATGWPVLAYGLAAAAVAAVVAGVVPAWRASRLDPMQVLKSAGPTSSAGRGERRLLGAVTMAQTALTLVLLVGAGLLIRTMIELSRVPAGYETRRILTMSVTEVQGNWRDFHHRALERVSALPGVQRAAFAWGVPLTGNSWPGSVEIEGRGPARDASERISLPLRSVTPGYFDLLGLSIVEGRDVRASDEREAPLVAVISEAFADHYFSDTVALGKKLWLRGREQPPAEVVGVVSNARIDDLAREAAPEIYLSLWQAGAFSKHLVIRTAADPVTLGTAVERALRSVDPTVAVENVKALDRIRSDSLAPRSFAMQLLVGFAAVASVLTLVGIYGVLSLSVASRRRELAIRSAVGAGQSDLRKLVLAEGFRLIAGGVIVGAAVAIVSTRVLSAFLFQVEPTDPLILIGVATLLAGVLLLACWVPTRRAARVEPLAALRFE